MPSNDDLHDLFELDLDDICQLKLDPVNYIVGWRWTMYMSFSHRNWRQICSKTLHVGYIWVYKPWFQHVSTVIFTLSQPKRKHPIHRPRRLSRNSGATAHHPPSAVVRHALEPGSSPVSQIRNFSIIAHIDHGARGLNQLGCAQQLHILEARKDGKICKDEMWKLKQIFEETVFVLMIFMDSFWMFLDVFG